jgi:CheY-like chemotaxis protein
VTLARAPGVGSTFRVYIPRVAAGATDSGTDASAPRPNAALTRVSGRQETIIVVDDEPTLRQLAQRALEEAGYRVLAAANGAEALERIEAYTCGIDLLVTDLVMPVMGGRELVEQLHSRGMAMRVLFVSGYTDDEVMRRGLLEPGCAFLSKPFDLDALTAKVGEVLDTQSGVPAFATGDDRAA